MLALLKTFSWQEFLHHPWRSLAALLAISSGVALAFAVHLINASAVSAFSSASKELSGQPDLVVRSSSGSFDERILGQLARHPEVALLSPILELNSYALGPARGRRVAVQIIGVDPLAAAVITPGLVARPFSSQTGLSLFAPDSAFPNPAVFKALGLVGSGAAADAVPEEQIIELQSELAMKPVRVRGSVGRVAEPSQDLIAGSQASASGPGPLIVMDIAAVQDLFGKVGLLSRIDLRLRQGIEPQQFLRTLELPAGLRVDDPDAGATRVERLSRAYRVNLTVLAMVALFTGSFLIYSVLSLSVIQRAPHLALLAVLGLTGRQRLTLILCEALIFGGLAAIIGIAMGSGLALLALSTLGADLGGGFFSAAAAPLHWQSDAALLYFGLGLLATVLGAWWPARLAQSLPVVTTLKGSILGGRAAGGPGLGLLLMSLGALASMLPPIFEIAVGAYLAVGLILIGGVLLLPYGLARAHELLQPLLGGRPLLLLALERGRRMGQSAATAVSAVVVSLSLAVALTVMVASFRDSVAVWLERVLPADLYLRSAASSAAADTVFLSPQLIDSLAATPGIARSQLTTLRSLPLRADHPPVVLLARPIGNAENELPMVGAALKPPLGHVAVFVSEAMVALYGMSPGNTAPLLEQALLAPAAPNQPRPRLFVAGIWRDYVRQFGSVFIDRDDYQRLTGDLRSNELALWLSSGANEEQVRIQLQQRLDALAQTGSGAAQGSGAALVEMASSSSLRAVSLRIFDRSFAVTYWLQAVAIGIGLFGVATSFSAQVLARRREFGLLAHAGLTRRQILSLVAAEACVWTLIGSVAGILLGLAAGYILVAVVNPQSFHWTMEFTVPWLRLLLLGLAVVAAGTVTAWLAGRGAASASAVLAVKEDW